MIFASYIFILIFLPLALWAWYQISDQKWRLISLSIFSYTFYGWWDWRFLSLLMASTILDYYCGQKVYQYRDSEARIAKKFMTLSILANLGILGVFKYYDFFVSSASQVLTALGFSNQPSLIELILPLGISFYTFQSMSYSIDIYREKLKPAESIFHFSAYVCMFPQLVVLG
jgi:alginate O-acetyltransferase complex protein AlgI